MSGTITPMSSIEAVHLIERAGVPRAQAEAIVSQIENVVDHRAATRHDVQVTVDNAKWQVIVFLTPIMIALVGLLATYLTVLINAARH